MIVKYRSTRADVWRTYAHVWRHGRLLKVMQLAIFVMFFNAAYAWLQSAGLSGASRFLLAASIGLAVLLVGAAYPQLRFKPEERTLGIGPAGISTTIGKRSGTIAWAKVARITPTSDAVYVVGTSSNSFTVPDRAFSSPAQRQEFIALATQWMKESRER